MVCVRNTGRGAHPEDAHRVFQPFLIFGPVIKCIDASLRN